MAPQSLLPIIYELPDDLTADEGWKKRNVWPLVNPNLNLSVRESFLAGELSKAEADGAGAVGLFASQHLNIEIGLAHKNDGWAGQHYWDESGEPSLTLKELVAASDVITAGVDGGGLDDLLSVSFIGRVKGSREWLHWSQTWAHKIVLERRKSEAPKLLDFAKDKDLIIVDDLKVAFNDVANLILSVDKSGKLKDIGFDTYGVVLIVEALQAAGIPKERIAGVRQGWSLQGAIKSAEVKLASGELTHASQPIMRWAVENAKIEIRGNAIAITKQTSGTAKIDPLMAMFDAVWVMSEIPENDVSGWQTDDMAALMSKIEAATAAAR